MSTSFATLVLSWLVTLGYSFPSLLGVGRTTEAVVLPAPERPLPECRYGDRVVRRGIDAEPPLVLVDTEFRLPRGYAPRDLRSTVGSPLQGRATVRAHVLDDLGRMARAARRAGTPLAIRTGYRSEGFQRVIFDGWVEDVGPDAALRASARPGHSEHELGVAIDLATPGEPAPWEQADWGATPTGEWLARHAWEHGFVMTYPPDSEAVTCYRYEPWHHRYVGRPVARALHVSGLTLREYLWYRTSPRDRSAD
jgi:D-alanyl-D-alanine carboxypeptidase